MYAGVPIAIPADVIPDTGMAALSAFATPKSVTSACEPDREDIAGLDVAMHDAAAMRVGERFDDVVQNPNDIANRQTAAPGNRRPQRLALDERHRVVQQLALDRRAIAGGSGPSTDGMRPGRQQRDDVRVLQLRGDLDLALESLAVHACRQLGRQHLDHDLPAERVLGRGEDAAHSAA